jgi:hypothetical protein
MASPSPYRHPLSNGGTVEIVPAVDSKPYLGGFRDRRTGNIFLDTSTQASGHPEGVAPPPKPPVRYERDAQTRMAPVTRSGQMSRTAVVQTAPNVRGIYLGPADAGREMTTRPYFDSEQWLIRRAAAALRLQCAWRCATARAALRSAREARELEGAARAAADAAADAAERDAAAAALSRRTDPRTAADFAALYDEVEEWRASTTARIKAEIPPSERTAAFSALLAKETTLLKNIDALRTAAARKNEAAAAAARLKSASVPAKWPLSHVPKAARTAAVDVTTPLTVRAEELARMYSALGEDPASVSYRTEILLAVKSTVSEFDCVLTREICALCERELDQLARGRPAEALAALRGRIQRAFLVFCEQPEFNPEVIKAAIAPADRAQKTMGAMLRTAALPSGASNVTKAKMSWQANSTGALTLGR